MKRFIKITVSFFLIFTAVSCSKKSEKKENPQESEMIEIPGKNIMMLTTEVTQELYTSIMDINPSYNKAAVNPVECVTWYDAVFFCNKLSRFMDMEPVYVFNGTTNEDQWELNVEMGLDKSVFSDLGDWLSDSEADSNIEERKTITINENANGFRLPSKEEWQYGAKAGKNFKYSGSNDIEEAGWYASNSENTTHPVALKKENAYGLYDMSGNVSEWVWDSDETGSLRVICNGSFYGNAGTCKVESWGYGDPKMKNNCLGFRVVCAVE